MKKVLFIFFIVLFLKLIVLFSAPNFYDIDEIIVYNISTQPIHLMFDTLTAEPHPPGFYILLKLFSFLPVPIIRLAFLLISSLLFLYGLYFGYKEKLIQKDNLEPGILLFLCSHVFLTTSFYLKQDIFTVPLLFVFLMYLLDYKQCPERKRLLRLFFISIAILFLGYVAFLYVLILLCFFIVITKSSKLFFTTIFVLAISLTLFVQLTYVQFITLQMYDRVYWASLIPNGFYYSLVRSVVFLPFPRGTNGILYGLCYTFVLIVSPFIGYFLIRQRRKFLLTTICFIVFSTMLFSLLNLFLSERYFVGIFFALSLSLGMLVEFVGKQIKIGLLNILIILSLGFSYVSFSQPVLWKSSFISHLNDFSREVNTPTGLIIQHPTASFIFNTLLNNSNIQSIVPFNANDNKANTYITKEILYNDVPMPIDAESIFLSNLKTSNLSNFLYIPMFKEYDPNNLFFNVLQDYCNDAIVKYDFATLFTSCYF